MLESKSQSGSELLCLESDPFGRVYGAIIAEIGEPKQNESIKNYLGRVKKRFENLSPAELSKKSKVPFPYCNKIHPFLTGKLTDEQKKIIANAIAHDCVTRDNLNIYTGVKDSAGIIHLDYLVEMGLFKLDGEKYSPVDGLAQEYFGITLPKPDAQDISMEPYRLNRKPINPVQSYSNRDFGERTNWVKEICEVWGIKSEDLDESYIPKIDDLGRPALYLLLGKKPRNYSSVKKSLLKQIKRNKETKK